MRTRSAGDPVSRSRSLHHKRPFTVAVFFTLVHYLCLIGVVTCLAIVTLNPKPASVPPLVVAFVASLVTWLIAFLRRRSARCPLCKGSPLLDSGAVKHAKAYRLPPFTYAATAVLGILFLSRFRCMYCGTPFDLLKRSSSDRDKR
jgi:hypothetical protein